MNYLPVAVFAILALNLHCTRPSLELPDRIYTTEQAIEIAANNPDGVTGVFEFTIKNSAQVGPRVFLNTEIDYRSPSSLNVAIPNAVADLFLKTAKINSVKDCVGRKMRAAGQAKRAKIAFLENGQQTGRYYYQTHLYVESATDMKVF